MEQGRADAFSPKFDYEYFKVEILKLTGIDLNAYKEKQMKRRINTLIERKGVVGYENFVKRLQDDDAELASFIDYITINVTEFFRTSDQWAFFETNALTDLISSRHEPLRVWSCACSTGEEPYSLAMSMAKYLPLDRIHITATDIDQNVLARAEQGLFSAKSMETVPEDLKQRYFLQTENGWQISEDIRNCVEFQCMDLLKDDYPANQDLIICRNVLIYFTEEAKNLIYQRFYDALAEGGYLFTGNTEQMIRYKEFGFTKHKNFLYKKYGSC